MGGAILRSISQSAYAPIHPCSPWLTGHSLCGRGSPQVNLLPHQNATPRAYTRSAFRPPRRSLPLVIALGPMAVRLTTTLLAWLPLFCHC